MAAVPAPAPVPRRRPGGALLEEAGELALFALRTLRALAGTPRYFSEVMRLNALVTRRTSLLLLVMTFFAGVSVANFGFFFLRSIGASDYVGLIGGLFSTRLLGFQMFGYVFASAVCCAITAELGSAKIQEEVAAYEAQGIDPMEMLVGTRVLACLLFVPLATVIALAGMLSGTFVTVVWLFQGNSAETYLSTFFSVQNIGDYIRLGIIIGAQTLVCSVVACYYGLHAKGGPVGVGAAVARGLALNLVVLHVTISIMSIWFWGGGDYMVPVGD